MSGEGRGGIIVRDTLNEGNIALGTVLADGTRQTPPRNDGFFASPGMMLRMIDA